MNEEQTANPARSLSQSLYPLVAVAFVVFFVVKVSFYAFTIPHRVPPDETRHFERAEFFSSALVFPEYDPASEKNHLRIARYEPSLYYFLAGKWISGNIVPLSDLKFLRLLSLLFACTTVYFGWRFIRILSDDRLVHVLFLAMLTNTLMFGVISASVSYDALVNMLAAMSICYFVDYLKNRTRTALIFTMLSLALGCLTKTSVMPLAFAILFSLTLFERKNLVTAAKRFIPDWKGSGFKQKWWLIVTLFVISLNVLLYGSNLLQFGHMVPKPHQILSEQEILRNFVYSRNYIFLGYKRGDLTEEQALELASEIEDQQSSLAIKKMVEWEVYRSKSANSAPYYSRVGYVVPWYQLMLRSTYGILGHLVLFREPNELRLYTIVLASALFMLVLRIFRKKIDASEIILASIALFYTLVLMQMVNYRAYANFEVIQITLQGRYLFPLLLPIYGIVAKNLLSIPSLYPRVLITLVMISIFVYGDFIFFMKEWGFDLLYGTL